MKNYFRFLLLTVFILGFLLSKAQDPNRFREQVDRLASSQYSFQPAKKLLVFTGSSSIAMWKDVADYFPEYNVVNFGFGGSHFSDLLYFYDRLVTRFKPDVLFIYEGDNDVAGNKPAREIYRDFKALVKRLKADLPVTKIVFISPKPSIARWNLRNEYHKINKKMARYCKKKNDNFEFADVWPVMLDENGNVFQDIFIEDGLHMNKKGYDLWMKVLSGFVE